MQLMHVYVQKSTSTTRPCSLDSDSGRMLGVLNQSCVSVNSGAGPSAFRPCAVASSVAWLAFAGAAFTLEPEPPHVEEPLATLNFARCPLISCRWLVTVSEHSSDAVRLTSGMCWATN